MEKKIGERELNEQFSVGIDIGGTTVKIAFIDIEGVILKKWEIPTRLEKSGAFIPQDIWKSVEQKAEEINVDLTQLIGIGVGAPGFVETETGYIYEAVNIGWKDYHLGQILTDLSGLPVYVENDANLAALGENWKGSGNRAENLIAITIGTGVGGGIIANGKIINGVNGMGGEIGHITVDPNGILCNCGRKGCLETVASASGIARIAMDYCENHSGENSLLVKRYEENGKVDAKDVFDLAAENVKEANLIVNHVADVLGLAIANAATITNPSRIVIGGGVSKAGNMLLLPLKKSYANYALPRVNEGSEFVIAELGNDAGVIGGAYMVMKQGNA